MMLCVGKDEAASRGTEHRARITHTAEAAAKSHLYPHLYPTWVN